jgi:hypothetical protein
MYIPVDPSPHTEMVQKLCQARALLSKCHSGLGPAQHRVAACVQVEGHEVEPEAALTADQLEERPLTDANHVGSLQLIYHETEASHVHLSQILLPPQSRNDTDHVSLQREAKRHTGTSDGVIATMTRNNNTHNLKILVWECRKLSHESCDDWESVYYM